MRTRRLPSLRFRLVAMAGLLALAAAYLTPVVDSDWNAWRFDHGHAALGAVGEHSHPWDHGEHPTSEVPGGEVVYTSSVDGVPGLTAIWLFGLAAVVVIMSSVLVRDTIPLRPRKVVHPPRPQPPNGSFALA